MNTIPEVHIGVDISKSSLDIYILPQKTLLKIDNSESAIKKFIKELAEYGKAQVVCEATGGYEKLLAKLLKKNGNNLWVVDPRRIRGFIVSTGCKTKTDKIDAQKIAEFSSKNTRDYLAVETTENQVQLQALVNRKNDLTKILASEKTRLKSPAHSLYLPSIRKIIRVLQAEVNLNPRPERRDFASPLEGAGI